MDSQTQVDPRMPLTSIDVLGERAEQLRELFPEAFVEGQIDFDRLRNALGDFVGEGRERYGLSWAGKADAIRAIQTPSVGTLVPCPQESINFDTTDNLFIEGDNLEVLKLLQKSYYGKVKMIYIDPPYNTGNEFIYPDNFREGLEEYLNYSGQSGDGGVRLSTNTETSGRYHSKWLDMMYPRLFMARNLLKEDGVIFVSIDDHEQHNLRLLMDEVFGSENFVASIIWQKVYSPKNTAKHFSEDHDYVLVYARDAEQWHPLPLPKTAEMEARYSNPDDDPRGPWKAGDLSARNYYAQGTYAINCPSGREIKGPPKGTYWRVSQKKFAEMDEDNRIWWGADGNNSPAIKRFLSEVKEGRVPQTLWSYKEVGHTQEAKKELLKYVHFNDTENVLNSVKPIRLIQRMLQIANRPSDNDIVLDFFGGSAATGHAIYKQNLEDGGNRRFILIQLPEPLPKPEQDLETIFDMGAARLKNVTNEINESEEGKLEGVGSSEQLPKLGFRKFRLSQSNFRIWDGNEEVTPERLREQLKLFADHVLPDRGEQDVLYELMLKAGLPLTAPIEEKAVAKQKFYAVTSRDALLFVCLANPITQECLRGMAELQPQRVICLDSAFGGNDQLKTNTVLEMKSLGIEFRTV